MKNGIRLRDIEHALSYAKLLYLHSHLCSKFLSAMMVELMNFTADVMQKVNG